ncbi:MAG TPA: SUMF1/EgtB/PvdO family nonheme iron enzyme [Candidatus Acidoferrales bacterium]|nr:SUMF1/EgtB/PvdO family nonheme iron enzyme [Candidatus Acidoferrales bacterium]
MEKSTAIEPVMAPIPEGWFVMGNDGGRDDERPAHRVWVDAFEMGAFQVTNQEYGQFLTIAKHSIPIHWEDANFSDPRQPVVAVSWRDAVAYCEWLSDATSRRYFLPTEAQWERAARGGVEGALYPWGDAGVEQVPDYARRWLTGPERVGLYTPNVYGLFNLGDNVHEWCSDWYDAEYYARSAERNPRGPENGTRKSSRGGSWRHHVKVTPTAARSSIPHEFKYADYGFRVVREE